MKKFFKTIGNEAVFIYVELKKTFSNEPSYFSSKRIERMLLFVSALCTINYWVWKNIDTIPYDEVLAVIITLLGFAGYTMVQTQREKPKPKNETKLKEDENTDN